MKYKEGDFAYFWPNTLVSIQIVKVKIENYRESGDYLIFSKNPYVYCYCYEHQLFDSSQECFDKSFPIAFKKINDKIEEYQNLLKGIKNMNEWKNYNRSNRINNLLENGLEIKEDMK